MSSDGKKEVVRLLEEIMAVLDREFLRSPNEVETSVEEYLDAGMTRCLVMQDELDPRFYKLEELLKKHPDILPPSILAAAEESLQSIRKEIDEARAYFKQTLESKRHDVADLAALDTSEKKEAFLQTLFNFAEEKRKEFKLRVQEIFEALSP